MHQNATLYFKSELRTEYRRASALDKGVCKYAKILPPLGSNFSPAKQAQNVPAVARLAA